MTKHALEPLVPEGSREMVRVEELADMLGMRQSTLYRWIHEKRCPLPYIQVNRIYMFHISHVKAFMRGEEITPVESQEEEGDVIRT